MTGSEVAVGDLWSAHRLKEMSNEIQEDEYRQNRRARAIQFEDIFKRLLARENAPLDEENLSLMFEVMATHLFLETTDQPSRRYNCISYDGAVDLIARVRKSRQVEFTGQMWILGDNTQWIETLRARVTDKRSTKQGIWITLWIGSNRAEGELSAAFGLNDGE